MFSLTVKAAKDKFFDRAPIIAALGRDTAKAFSKFGAYVRQRSKQSIRKRKAASKPGSPPSSHTGLLKDFIYFAFDESTRSVVIGPAKLGSGSDAPRLLEDGGETTVARLVRSAHGKKNRRPHVEQRRVVIAARPYMHPAFDSTIEELPEIWELATRGAASSSD